MRGIFWWLLDFPQEEPVVWKEFPCHDIIMCLTTVCLKLRVFMMPTLPSLVASQVVMMTTCGATSDGKVGIMTTLHFLWLIINGSTQGCYFPEFNALTTIQHNDVSDSELLCAVLCDDGENLAALILCTFHKAPSILLSVCVMSNGIPHRFFPQISDINLRLWTTIPMLLCNKRILLFFVK